MRGLRIILDKSVVFRLNNFEVDALDRYFFQIVPPILTDEILADLTKEPISPKAIPHIVANSYRISGNRGLARNYREILEHSLLGEEVPMEGKYFPARERIQRSESGSLTTIVETPAEDELIARWERGEFSEEEREWARTFRARMERPLNPKLYLDNIAKAGLSFSPPQSDQELIAAVHLLLSERTLQPRLFNIVRWQFNIPVDLINKATLRWSKEGRKMFKEFAPYAFFCLRASFLWALGLTNPQLFPPDKNDRKDLEYCYYLPHTQIFASTDEKFARLVPALLESYQSFVDGVFKQDLDSLSTDWSRLTKDEQIKTLAERDNAPPENPNSIVYELWQKHSGVINPSLPLEILDVKATSSKYPGETLTLREILQRKYKEAINGKPLSEDEFETVRQEKTSTSLISKTRQSKARLQKRYPQLKDSDFD
jgi:hypothetical protein